MANLAIHTKLALFVFNVIKGSHVGNKLQVFMIHFIGPSSFKKAMTIEMEGFPQGERPPRKRMRSMAEKITMIVKKTSETLWKSTKIFKFCP
jgi:enolase